VSFKTPVFSASFQGDSVVLHPRDAGLIPGIPYLVQMDHRPAGGLSLQSAEIVQPQVDCDLFRSTWTESGRFLTGVAYSQLTWDKNTHRWTPNLPAIPIGQALYNAELVLRPALSAARTCNDLPTMDEIALYYTAMLDKTQTIESLLKMPNLIAESRERMSASNPGARTFAARFGSDGIGEGELFNAQWLHPAARLIRFISQRPAEERTPGMRTFVIRFTPFLAKDQLLRFLFDQSMPTLAGRAHRGRVARWELAMRGLQGEKHWDTAMSDIDIWLLTSAAELLGAHANDPSVPLTNEDELRLKQALRTGVRFFQSKRTLLADTRDFAGRVVGSASYFNGDYDGESEMQGTAVTGEKFPADPVAPARRGASWDIGHMYRVAVFLRALYENRKATDVAFPTYEDLQLVVNQYVYKVFNGDFKRPLFRNNFDGSDGWFRVGYNGDGYGQPPSAYCDMHDVKRLCMTPGSIVGWPELNFVNPDLARLEEALIRMAFDSTAETRAFADRYYYWLAPFAVIQSGAKGILGGALYAVAAENADRFSAIGASKQRGSPNKSSSSVRPKPVARTRGTRAGYDQALAGKKEDCFNQSSILEYAANTNSADVRIHP
jgi:hypothetical protein